MNREQRREAERNGGPRKQIVIAGDEDWDELAIGYVTDICAATRTSPDLALGASPRGSISLLLCAKGMAACNGRDYVVPDDVKDLCVPVLRHRLVRRPEAEIAGVTETAAVERAVNRVPVPR